MCKVIQIGLRSRDSTNALSDQFCGEIRKRFMQGHRRFENSLASWRLFCRWSFWRQSFLMVRKTHLFTIPFLTAPAHPLIVDDASACSATSWIFSHGDS
jgi:hypothetical protein